MAYQITNACTRCGACKDTCPVSAISEGEPCFKLDTDICVECGQCVDVCPVQAIKEN